MFGVKRDQVTYLARKHGLTGAARSDVGACPTCGRRPAESAAPSKALEAAGQLLDEALGPPSSSGEPTGR